MLLGGLPRRRRPLHRGTDRIVNIYAIDPQGRKHEIIGLTGQTLLRALINSGLINPASHCLEKIDTCSAKFEVHITQEWLEEHRSMDAMVGVPWTEEEHRSFDFCPFLRCSSSSFHEV
ncbi:hypothetical protein Cni_G18725 [Canna indica]|uniref:Uncharacterized protein n=1 Tax=Canna indica TaxID=4628 RepID=A0AAQ3KQ81_9LILI|nr:hypothetical protein Cni_G18725 [Canna indica]